MNRKYETLHQEYLDKIIPLSAIDDGAIIIINDTTINIAKEQFIAARDFKDSEIENEDSNGEILNYNCCIRYIPSDETFRIGIVLKLDTNFLNN